MLEDDTPLRALQNRRRQPSCSEEETSLGEETPSSASQVEVSQVRTVQPASDVSTSPPSFVLTTSRLRPSHVSFSYPPKSSPHRVVLAPPSPRTLRPASPLDSRLAPSPSRPSPKFEEFTRAWNHYKRSRPDWTSALGSSLPSPKPSPHIGPFPSITSPSPRVLPSPPRRLPLESADSMAPPVTARTMSCVIYIGVTAIFLCGLAAMLTADFSSGLVQQAMMPLRMAIKPVSCEPQTENDREIVHIDCPIRKQQSFSPPSDFSANLPPFRGLFFEMRVEMYQYNIIPGMFRSTLGGVWAESLLPSQDGWTWLSTAKNPDFFPHVPGAGRHFGNSLYGGGFKLERPHMIDFHTKRQLELRDDGVFVEESEKPPTKVNAQNTQLFNNFLYTGDPYRPVIGDIRVSFYGSAATHLSAVGRQSPIIGGWASGDRALKGFPNPLSKTNETRTLVMEGDYTAKELLDAFTYENDVPSRYLVATRGLGFLTTFFWVFFTYRILRKDAISTTCGMTLFTSVALCVTAVGLTKLTYSIPACIACVITGAILFSMSCGLQRQGNSGAAQPAQVEHEYTVIQQEDEKAPPATHTPTNASHSNSVYAAI